MKNVLVLVAALFLSVFSYAQDAAEKINQANEALKAEDFAKAFSLYDEAMKNLGDVQVEPAINFNIGFAAYKANNLKGAIEYFDKAIEADVNVSKSYEYKALTYIDNKDYVKAVENYEKAYESAEDSDKGTIVYNAAIIAFKANMLEKSIDLFGKCVDANYRGDNAIFFKALAYRKQKNNDAYKVTLEEGIAKYPTNKKISSALVNIYVAEGNNLYKKGAGILNGANEKVNNGDYTTNDDAYKAEYEKAKKEFKAAIVVLEKAKAIDADNKNVNVLLDACNSML